MNLPGLVLVVILTCSDANHVNHVDHGNHVNHQNIDCEDCVENGPWFPLFKPSQIISSELPEHEQYHSQEAPPPLTYATARPQVSHDSQSHECDDRQVVELASQEVAGIDSPVKSYGGHGEHRVEWDHYGDVTTVATVYNSLEDRGGAAPGVAGVSGEDRSDASGHGSYLPEQENSASVRSQEESFFDNGSFFDEKQSSKNSFPEDFEISNEYPLSGEHHHHSNSVEHDSHESFRRGKTPVATSYASISSVFESRPIARSRDLLHPDLTYNDIPHYINLNPSFPSNKTKQYLVHEPNSHEVPGLFHITRVAHGSTPLTISRNNKPPPATGPLGPRPSSYVPFDHPVYRYVKVHGGLTHHRPPQSRSTLRWDDLHPQLRSKFPFKYLRPRVHVQNHENFVHHVVPTKDPFSDSFWRESQKIEDLKPPPLGQTLTYYKKKPSHIETKNIARRRQSPGFMYIIRRNKKY